MSTVTRPIHLVWPHGIDAEDATEVVQVIDWDIRHGCLVLTLPTYDQRYIPLTALREWRLPR